MSRRGLCRLPHLFFFFDREVVFFLSAITPDGPAGPFATCLSVMTNKRYHKTSPFILYMSWMD
jgi:hypothetical protein